MVPEREGYRIELMNFTIRVNPPTLPLLDFAPDLVMSGWTVTRSELRLEVTPLPCMIVRGTIYDWYAIPLVLAGGVVAVVAFYWRFFVQWLNGIRGRDWPAVSATIDIVSVVKQEEQTGHGTIISYLATLTYFYHNPELQTGDYCRNFDEDEEDDAQAWAASYKGSAVTVHVDPRDPAHSVLRKADL